MAITSQERKSGSSTHPGISVFGCLWFVVLLLQNVDQFARMLAHVGVDCC